MSLKVDTHLGSYKIIAKLGAGGMGEIYRALDTRLDLAVAIKVLPAECAKDAERVRRSEQEARATSAFNHPNILTVYDIGNHDGARAQRCPAQRDHCSVLPLTACFFLGRFFSTTY
jgi:serine/threonine protein kinase